MFLKIAINTRFLIKDKLEGIGVFTFEILKELCKRCPDYQFYFLFDRKPDPSFIFSDNIKAVHLFPPARHPILWIIWYEISVKRWLKKNKPEIFISMDGMIPLKTGIKTISVIHDLAFESFPFAVPFWVRKYYRYYFHRFAENADKIITVSEFSKKDIITRYKIPPDKITVAFNGSQSIFKPADNQLKNTIKQELTNGNDYFLYNGSLHPRKNIVTLLKAFDIFKETDQKGIKLVISGRKAWMTKEIEDVYLKMKFKNEVIFTGWLEEKKLAEIMGSALAFIYISLFEGFGIPVLNAMNCSIPVIVSDTTSLPEVAGNAGLYADPNNPDEIAQKMHLIATNENLRNNLIDEGFIQRKKFSWDKSVETFQIVIHQLIE